MRLKHEQRVNFCVSLPEFAPRENVLLSICHGITNPRSEPLFICAHIPPVYFIARVATSAFDPLVDFTWGGGVVEIFALLLLVGLT